jgi:PRTRC genetic system ThiF family protein
MYNLHEYFHTLPHAISIDVVGCGGTGSLLLPRLARIDFALRQMNHPGIHVTAYDFDTVEEFNIGRQNFGPGDVGMNKAECLISKINMAYGIQWEARREKRIPKWGANITISCVDNVEFRKGMSKYKAFYNSPTRFDYRTPFYWIDCGNGKNFGQIVMADFALHKQKRKLKNVYDIYGDIQQFDNLENQGILGCSYEDKLNQQDLFINDEIALKTADLVYKMLRYKQIDYHGVVVNQESVISKPFKI